MRLRSVFPLLVALVLLAGCTEKPELSKVPQEVPKPKASPKASQEAPKKEPKVAMQTTVLEVTAQGPSSPPQSKSTDS